MTQGYKSIDATTLKNEVTRRDNILILGLRKAGKSSSFQVVYESLNPEDALQEGVTQAHKSEPYIVDNFHPMKIWDGTSNFAPPSSAQSLNALKSPPPPSRANAATNSTSKVAGASTNGNDSENDFKGRPAFGTGDQLYWTECSAVIFVVDSQGEYSEALERLNDMILSAYSYNPLIHFHVFVHKADGHSNDYRYDTLQDIQQRVADNLSDASQSFIFAPTAYEILSEVKAALDTVTQTSQQDGIGGEQLASAFSTTSGSKFNAMQSNFTTIGQPSGFGSELDRDVRLSFHVTSILNCSINIAWSRVQIDLMDTEVSRTLEAICNGLCNTTKLEKVYLFDVPSKTYIAADGSPFDEATFEVISDYITFLVQFSGLYGSITNDREDQERYSTSTLKLAPDTTLAFHQVNGNLALIYVVRNDLQAKNAGMIEYNISIARKAIMETYNLYTNT